MIPDTSKPLLPPELDGPIPPEAPRTPRTQVERLFARFNVTAYGMAKMLGCNASTCFRWTYPKPKGTGGTVPAAALRKITAMARVQGVLLTAEDLDPRELKA